jgi:hypothetical protein
MSREYLTPLSNGQETQAQLLRSQATWQLFRVIRRLSLLCFPIRLQRFQKLGHDACCSHETDVPVHFAKVQTHLISPAP